jgi:hypothetical protein
MWRGKSRMSLTSTFHFVHGRVIPTTSASYENTPNVAAALWFAAGDSCRMPVERQPTWPFGTRPT